VSFSGANSSDPDPGDSITYYHFDFGDGSQLDDTGPSVSHTYTAAGTYTARLVVTDSHGAKSSEATQTITATPTLPDLVVTALTASNNQAKQGDKVTFSATIKNQGQASAGASVTEFKLDGRTVLDTPATGALAPGDSTTVSVQWQTTAKTAKGNHTVVATADVNRQVGESDETNNTTSLTIYLQGNRTK